MRWLAILALCVVGCDNRACLAQSDLFAGYRPELVAECCQCLAHNGTRKPGAACAETFVDADGGQAILPDAGPEIPADGGPGAPQFPGDDLDNVIEPDEVPCMCSETEASCVKTLTERRGEITVTGSCLDQGGGLFATRAPCQDACKGVLTFSPLEGQ